jgi:non-ribosomal peptide synthetase component F
MEACRKASFRLRVPLSAFLLSAFVRVLAGRTGQPRMIIGTHFGGRTAERWRDAVGLYTNTVPIVLDVDPAASEPEIVQHVNAQYLGAYEHQDYPLQWLLERVPVPRSLNRPVLFQIVFSYQSAQSGAAADAWAGATETSFDLIETPTSTFELQLHVTSASSGTVARFDYSTDLFAREFVAGIAGEFVNVVERSSSPTYAHA